MTTLRDAEIDAASAVATSTLAAITLPSYSLSTSFFTLTKTIGTTSRLNFLSTFSMIAPLLTLYFSETEMLSRLLPLSMGMRMIVKKELTRIEQRQRQQQDRERTELIEMLREIATKKVALSPVQQTVLNEQIMKEFYQFERVITKTSVLSTSSSSSSPSTSLSTILTSIHSLVMHGAIVSPLRRTNMSGNNWNMTKCLLRSMHIFVCYYNGKAKEEATEKKEKDVPIGTYVKIKKEKLTRESFLKAGYQSAHDTSAHIFDRSELRCLLPIMKLCLLSNPVEWMSELEFTPDSTLIFIELLVMFIIHPNTLFMQSSNITAAELTRIDVRAVRHIHELMMYLMTLVEAQQYLEDEKADTITREKQPSESALAPSGRLLSGSPAHFFHSLEVATLTRLGLLTFVKKYKIDELSEMKRIQRELVKRVMMAGRRGEKDEGDGEEEDAIETTNESDQEEDDDTPSVSSSIPYTSYFPHAHDTRYDCNAARRCYDCLPPAARLDLIQLVCDSKYYEKQIEVTLRHPQYGFSSYSRELLPFFDTWISTPPTKRFAQLLKTGLLKKMQETFEYWRPRKFAYSRE